MVWARLRIVDCKGTRVIDGNGLPQERLFNLAQVQWWIGHGTTVELQYASQAPVFVELADIRMEHLTGSSGGYP